MTAGVPDFDDVEQAKAWADAWVNDHEPADLAQRVAGGESEHLEFFSKDYGRFVSQFEVEYSALVEIIDQINFVEKASWPDHRAVQYVLVAYNVKTFSSALDRLRKGYYADCITLTRGLYETFVRILFISCHPDDAYNVLVFKPPKGARTFNLTNFLRDELGLEWETKYGVMSTFAHSNSFQVLSALERALERSGEPELFGLGFDRDPSLAEAAIPFLQFVLLAHLRFAAERLAGDVALPDQLASTAADSVALLTYGLVNHPKEYWRMVARDLDVLFETLAVADRREDWKACLRRTKSTQ